MKKIILFLTLCAHLIASIINSPLLSINEEGTSATVKVQKVDIGMSGFVVHDVSANHTSILNSVVVTAFDTKSKIATLHLNDYNGLRNNALPTGKWRAEVGDMAILAFGYSRALLVSPNEEIYYRISKSIKIQWLHPDIFATILSFRGHPTPLKEDFDVMSDAASVGLLFIYIEKKVYTVDAKSFSILSISDAPLLQDSVQLPFYSRVEKIDAAWWGEGSDALESYAPYYYELLVKYNRKNRALYKIINDSEKDVSSLLSEFEIKE